MHLQREHQQAQNEESCIKMCSDSNQKVDALKQARETGLPHGVLVGGGQAWVTNLPHGVLVGGGQAWMTNLPHGVLVGGGQAWVGGRRAAGRSHDPVSQQEIPEEGGHKQVLHASAPCCLTRCPTQSGACMCHTASKKMDV